MRAARQREPKKQCGLHLDQAKATKKTFTRLGKGLAYNASVVAGPGVLPVMTALSQRRIRAAQATPLWRERFNLETHSDFITLARAASSPWLLLTYIA